MFKIFLGLRPCEFFLLFKYKLYEKKLSPLKFDSIIWSFIHSVDYLLDCLILSK